MSQMLNREQIMQLAPSVYSQGHNRSDHYVKINTGQIVDYLFGEGYSVTSAQQVRGRTAQSRSLASHMVRFRHRDAGMVHGCVPEIILFNSHDGSKSWQINTGFFRFVCANGMICGTTETTHRIRHIGDHVLNEVVQAVRAAHNSVYINIEQINQMSRFNLSIDQTVQLGKRYSEIVTEDDPHLRTRGLGLPYRREDHGADAWSMLNRVQENWMKGRYKLISTNENSQRTMQRKARAVTNIERIQSVNRALWNATIEAVAA